MGVTTRGGVGVVIGLLVVFLATDAQAQQFLSTGRDTLRELPGVEVIVEPLPAELEQSGFTASALRTNVEAQLRAGGITIYASQTENPSPAKAYLYVHLNGLTSPGQGYALSAQVHLRQTLRSLVTGSAIVNAMSWDQHVLVVLPRGLAIQSIGGEVRSLVDRFVQDWRAVH